MIGDMLRAWFTFTGGVVWGAWLVLFAAPWCWAKGRDAWAWWGLRAQRATRKAAVERLIRSTRQRNRYAQLEPRGRG